VQKQKAKAERSPLKCDRPPKEALRLALLVKPPNDWNTKPKKQRKR